MSRTSLAAAQHGVSSQLSSGLCSLLLAALALGLAACGTPSVPTPDTSEGTAAAASPLDPQDPSILRRPFTAEEIRDEWVEGFTLKLRRTTVAGQVLERWKVVGADSEGADIEYATLDGEEAVGEPQVQHSSWTELRDHASFPADRSTVDEVTLDTALGRLDGWLYTVRDGDAGTETELFFARDLPGAPVRMRMLKDGAPLVELEQVERSKPAAP